MSQSSGVHDPKDRDRPATRGTGGAPYLKVREKLNNLIAAETGQDVEKVTKDSDRNFWMDSAQACDYGLVSAVIKSASELP